MSREDPGDEPAVRSRGRTVVDVLTSRARCVVAAAAAAVTGLAGCSSATNEGSVPSSVSVSSQRPPSTAAEPAAARQPLALVYNVHRPPLDLGIGEARRIESGQGVTWPYLGQHGGRVRVRRGHGAQQRVEQSAAVMAVVPASRVRPTVQVARVGGVDPLRNPRRYPLTTRAAEAVPAVTTIDLVGDIMLGRRVGESTASDPGASLRPMQQRLARADLTVGNLESTLSTAGAPRQGDDSFAADPAVLPALESAGFDLLSLANNHTGDFGPGAFRQTMHRIDRTPIARVGAGGCPFNEGSGRARS